MAMPETLMKVLAGKKVLEGGIKGVNEAFSGFTLQARVDKIRKKKQAKEDKEQHKKDLAQAKAENKQFLREQGNMRQALADMSVNFFRSTKQQEEALKAQEELTKETKKQADEAKSDGDKKEKTGGRQAGTPNKEKTDDSGIAAPAAIVNLEGGEPTVVQVQQEAPVPVISESMKELLAIEKDLLEIDKRRDSREIKEARRALEDRRDAKRSMKGKGLGLGPTLNKKDGGGGGILSMLGRFAKSIPGLIAIGGTTATTAIAVAIKKWKAPKITLPAGILDDIARNADEAAKLAAAAAEKARLAAASADNLKPIVTSIDDVVKTGVKATNIVNYGDDIARTAASASRQASMLGGKVDDVAGAVKLVAPHIDETIKGVARAGTYADDFAGIARNITAGTDAVQTSLKAGVQSTNVGKLTVAIDGLTTASGKLSTSTQLSTVAGSIDNVAGSVDYVIGTLDNVGPAVSGVSTEIKGVAGTLDNVGPAISGVGDKVDDTARAIKTVATKVDTLDDFARVTALAADEAAKAAAKAAQLAKLAPTLTSPAAATTALTQSDEALRAAAAAARGTPATTATSVTGTTNLVVDAADKADELAKIATKGATGFSRFMTRVGKVLAPLDVINKMDQGQGFFESIANMGVEISAMVVGGVDGVAELAQYTTGLGSGEGFIKKGKWGDRSRALEVGDIMGNEEKWQTSKLEQGIGWAVAKATGTEQAALKKQYTDEQKALTYEAENKTGAVDVGFGQGQIEDLEELTNLNPETLKALLDVHVWKDKDQKMIEAIMNAKLKGEKVEYDDRGFWKSEVVKFGDKGKTAEDYMAGSPTVGVEQGVDTSGAGVVTGDRPLPTMMEASDVLEGALEKTYLKGDTLDAGTQEYADWMNEVARLEQDLDELDMMSAEEFNKLTPDSNIMDSFYKAGTTSGSIFVHDVHLLDYLKGNTGKMAVAGGAYAEDLAWKVTPDKMTTGPGITEGNTALDSTRLEQAVVTAAMAADASKKEGGGNMMVAAPVDNSTAVTNQINTSSTAHAPMSPAGMGHMGINTPRG